MSKTMNLTEVEEFPSKANLIPDGSYALIIEKTEWKMTKAGTGKFAAFTFNVMNPGFEKRKIWHNFNLDIPSPKGVAFAQADLKRMLTAANWGDFSKVAIEDLIGLPVMAYITSEHTPPFDAKNVIKNWINPSPKLREIMPVNSALPEDIARASVAPFI